MILVLGILSLFQMTILPGLLILKLIRFKGKSLQYAVFIFGTSLIANYLLVCLMVILHVYIQPVVIAICVLEIFAILYLFRENLNQSWVDVFQIWWESLVGFLNSLLPHVSDLDRRKFLINLFLFLFRLVAFIFAVSSLLWIGRVFLANLGTVFNEWDAVVSWNPWAVEWAQNQIPVHSYQYPQLIPTNWSLSYVLMGNLSIQFFAKALMPLFLFFILVMIFDLGLEDKTAGFFIAITVTRLMIKNFLGEFIADGYCDIPAAFFAFLAIYSLLKGFKDSNQRNTRKVLILGAIFAGGAAITKQTGGYILGIYPLMAYLLILQHTQGISFWQKAHQALFLLGISLILAAPWYIYKQITFAIGTDSTEVGMVLAHTFSTYDAAGFLSRSIQALSILEKYFWVAAFIIPAMFFLKPAYRWIALFIALPYTLLWAIFLSTDTRNLALAMPFIGLLSGMGFGSLVEWCINRFGRFSPERWRVWILIVVLLIIVTAAAILVPSEILINKQNALQRQIFNSDINAQVYLALENEDSDSLVLTNYPVQYLPGLEDRQLGFWYNNPQDFQTAIANPQVRFLLVPGYANEEIAAQIEGFLAAGDFTLLYSDSSWIPYRLIEINR